MREQALVLDTHVWIWLVAGDSRLSRSVRQRIDSSLAKNAILIPAICVWEVAMLWKRNRIQLHQPINSWVRSALEEPGCTLVPLTEDISLEAALLPGEFRSDPADCMIIATTRVNRAILVTADRQISDYGNLGHVDVLVV